MILFRDGMTWLLSTALTKYSHYVISIIFCSNKLMEYMCRNAQSSKFDVTASTLSSEIIAICQEILSLPIHYTFSVM